MALGQLKVPGAYDHLDSRIGAPRTMAWSVSTIEGIALIEHRVSRSFTSETLESNAPSARDCGRGGRYGGGRFRRIRRGGRLERSSRRLFHGRRGGLDSAHWLGRHHVGPPTPRVTHVAPDLSRRSVENKSVQRSAQVGDLTKTPRTSERPELGCFDANAGDCPRRTLGKEHFGPVLLTRYAAGDATRYQGVQGGTTHQNRSELSRLQSRDDDAFCVMTH